MELSQTNKALLLAVKKGYSVDVDGNLVRNDVKKNSYLRNGYKCMCIRVGNNKTANVAIHRIQAYQKYGEMIFVKGIECRHKNNVATDNSFDNIIAGTASQNKMDIPSEVRIARARHASSFNRAFTNEQVQSIIDDHNSGLSYKKLCEKYKTSKSTLSFLFNKAMYKPSLSILVMEAG